MQPKRKPVPIFAMSFGVFAKHFLPDSYLVSNDLGITFDSSADYWLDVQVLEKLTEAVVSR